MESTIGDRLRELRETMGVSQGELSSATGIDQSILSKYERGMNSPTWRQIERILDALGQPPTALFPECNGDQRSFSMAYYERWPDDLKSYNANPAPTMMMSIHHTAAVVRLKLMVPVDGRYILVRNHTPDMIPDIYPGDLLFIDTERQPSAGKVLFGFLRGTAYCQRLIKHQQVWYLVASNRRYPPIPWDRDEWTHVGCVVTITRDVTQRYMGGDPWEDEPSKG